jgi:hypothetical protein
LAKKKKAETPPTQIIDGQWYAAAHGPAPHSEECCDCGLTHLIEYKLENGRIWYRYTIDKRATTAARKRRGIDVDRLTPTTTKRPA